MSHSSTTTSKPSSTPNKVLIEVENVSKKFHENTVLENISFTVEEGDVLAIIGPNGAGKSTLVKLIMGLLKPSSGSIRVKGKDPKISRTSIGYVPQRFEFDRWLPMTVYEFLALSVHVAGIHENEEKDIISQRLKDVGVSGLESQMIATLSGGQMQRVLIARALLSNKEILFLDEPVAGIDMEGQQEMYELITRVNTEFGTTCVLISHELDVVYTYASHVLCLNKELLCHGLPKHAITEDVLRKMYGKHTAQYVHKD